jgi:cullin 3
MAKRFVLKPYARPDAMSQHTAMETFSMLQQAILKIYAQEQSTLTYEELYRCGRPLPPPLPLRPRALTRPPHCSAAYLMVLHKHGDLLYNGVLETVKRHLSKLADGIRKAPDDAMLARLNEAWSMHTRDMTMVRDILMYMDKSYVPPARKLLSYDAGTLAFRETVTRDPAIRARMLRLVLGSVAAARGGAALNAPLLRGIVGMLVSLGISSISVYTEDLEGPLLEEVGATAKAETAAYLAAHSAPEYLEHAEKRLRAEVATAREFVHPSTLPKLEAALHRVLIADHAVPLLDKEGSGLVQLLERDAMVDLGRMYRLFGLPRGAVAWKDRSGTTRSVPPLVALRDAMKGHIAERCRALVRDPEAQKDPSLYIRRLCELREKFVAIVESPFRGDKDFARAAKESFELVLNERGDSTTSEYLSLFLDDHFRGGFKGMSDAAVDEVLNSAIAVFRFLSNKDEFEAWYKAHLQKRLLSNKVGSDDAERLMISKLKTGASGAREVGLSTPQFLTPPPPPAPPLHSPPQSAASRTRPSWRACSRTSRRAQTSWSGTSGSASCRP